MFYWLAAKSRGWLLGISSFYFLTRFLRLDELVIDFLDSKDTLYPGALASLKTWELILTVLNVSAVLYLLGVLIATLVGTDGYKDYRARFADDVRTLRISEVFLWAVTLAQVALVILMWFLVWLGGSAFSVIATYPVIGRLVILVVFLLLLMFALRSRAMIITLALASYLVTLLGIDRVLVELFSQQDRFRAALADTSSLFAIQGVVSALGFFIPVLLAWTAVLAIARVVRERTRSRLENWVDSRRLAIYGGEDHSGDRPTRVSVLAVLALVFALWFPVLGLVLAYAARNDFVSAKPRKSGVDLAVAATILGWFGLGVQLFLAILWVVAYVFLEVGLLEFFSGTLAILFGLD